MLEKSSYKSHIRHISIPRLAINKKKKKYFLLPDRLVLVGFSVCAEMSGLKKEIKANL